MEKIFLQILNMSLTASYVILVLLIVQLLIKRLPKIYSYALWSIVFFRLVSPFSFESIYSLVFLNSNPIPKDIGFATIPQVSLGIEAIDRSANEFLALQMAIPATSANPMQIWIGIGMWAWILGIGIILSYSIISLIRLRLRLVGAVKWQDNIYLVDHIASPFVVGLVKPKIYLPSSLSEKEQEYIILHEKTHIKRLDHVIKMLAFLVLTIHWFNPLVWLSFFLFSKDMEMSCDESVIRHMDKDIRSEYSKSLLSFSFVNKKIGPIPLAFGEKNTKSRIKNLLNYRKPAFWISAIAALACLVLAICLIANREKPLFEEPKDTLSLVLDQAFIEAKKIEKIDDIESPLYISKDTAYLAEANEINICEVIFPLEGFDNKYAIGVGFVREDESSEWKIDYSKGITVYDNSVKEPDNQDSREEEILLVEEIKNKINMRKIVNETYFSSFSDDSKLIEMLNEYNQRTQEYYEYFYQVARDAIDFVFDEVDFAPDILPAYPVSVEVYEEMVLRIADNSLYKDCTQRFLEDPLLVLIIEKEAGGSAGLWPYFWHTEYLNHLPEMKRNLANYFLLINDIEKSLAARLN